MQQRCSDEQRWRTRCTARCRGAEVLSGCRGRWCRGVAVVQKWNRGGKEVVLVCSGAKVGQRWCRYSAEGLKC